MQVVAKESFLLIVWIFTADCQVTFRTTESECAAQITALSGSATCRIGRLPPDHAPVCRVRTANVRSLTQRATDIQ